MTPQPPWSARTRVLHPPLWVLLTICALVLIARRPDALLNPQFWAEDGYVFYREAYADGAKALLEPYAGYLHTLPRIIAAVAVLLDPIFAPAFFMVAALASTLYVAARTQSTRSPLPRHAGTALVIVLVPDAFETLLNLTNAQWPLAGGFLLLLISADPSNRIQFWHDAIAALLLGLTGPFAILLAPLFLSRALQRRSRPSAVLAAVVGVCAAVQGWNVAHGPPIPRSGPFLPELLLAVPGMRVTASLFAGYLVPPDYPPAVETALGLVALAGVTVLALRGGPARGERVALAIAFGLFLAGGLYRCRYVLPDFCHASFGSRYLFPPMLIAWWLLLAAAADDRRWLARTATVAALWSIAINVPRLREPPLADLGWSVFAAKIRAGEEVSVPINPSPWRMQLPARGHSGR